MGSRLAHIFGGQCYYVHASAITTSEELCLSLKADAAVQQALEMAKHTDYSMVGIGVAGGKAKVKAILGAIHGRFMKILITDEETANNLIKLEEKLS